jgi:DNA-binding response OmpR family regulator
MSRASLLTKVANSRTILVVDDDSATRRMLELLLTSQGFKVATAPDGPSAIERIKQGVDLLLLDLMMPRMDGIEVCGVVRKDLRLLTLPIVMVSALSDRESRLRAKEAGADDFLLKPVDSLELLVRIENLLKLRAYHERLERQAELLQQELTRVTSRLRRVERLGTVGALASSLGSELNQLAATYRETLHEARSRGSLGADLLERLDHATLQLESHAARLLKVSDTNEPEDDVTDLCAVVEQAYELARNSGRLGSAQLVLELPPQRPFVMMKRTQLVQVLLHLFANASDALLHAPQGTGTITVRVSAFDGTSRARLLITDNGSGIDEQDLARVFDPYFTTKAHDLATGFGLTFVRSACEAIGGRVVITSRKGEGTTVALDLPALTHRPVAVRESMLP